LPFSLFCSPIRLPFSERLIFLQDINYFAGLQELIGRKIWGVGVDLRNQRKTKVRGQQKGLQAKACNPLFLLVGGNGFEPSTSGM